MAVSFLLSRTEVTERWELRSEDARLNLRGPRVTNARIVIIELSDSTLKEWPEPIIFWGIHYAEILKQAKRNQASWVGLDFIPTVSADEFLETVSASAEHRPDRAFAEALRESHGKVILSNIYGNGSIINPNPQFISLPEMENRIGFADLPLTLDDVTRMSSLYVVADPVRLSFPSRIAAYETGINSSNRSDLQVMAGSVATQNKLVTFRINYILSPFPRISAERFARGRLSDRERQLIRNAIVLVGATYRGSQDKHVIPTGHFEDGIEINANAISTLIDHRALRRPTQKQECLLAFLIALISMVIVTSVRFRWGIASIVTLPSVWSLLSIHLITTHDFLLPLVGPMIVMVLPCVAFHIVRAFEESYRRLAIERAFGRYISPQIRNYLLSSPENARMGGSVCIATVVFLDIRGVTTYSEGRNPSAIMNDLNILFSEIVPIIDRYGGLLYSYTGDGFLAVFGAPYPLDNHAQAAVDAMLDIVRHTGQRYTPSGTHTWRVGCGIHSGPVSCGSLGVADRSEFTVIGDTVNLASRLESLNKEFGTEVVLSEETMNMLRTLPGMNGPFNVEIRGRRQKACVYSISTAAKPTEEA